MLGALVVNRALMFDAERARLSPPDPMPAHLDLQPAIAACRTASAASWGLLAQPTARQEYGKRKSMLRLSLSQGLAATFLCRL
jgi:hypothetical protein